MSHMTIAALCSVVLLAQATPSVSGHVSDAGNLPLPGVVVALKGAATIAVTTGTGDFTIAIAATSGVLVFSLPGFETREIAVTPAAAAKPLSVTLSLAKMADQVVVHAPVAGTPVDDPYTLRPLDVVRTPGAQADLMRALLVMPGVTVVDEGAGLFVRGGDVSETTVRLDGAVVNHPYRYETPTGGFRGAVAPFLTQGISFSTGGFGAEYGDTLSGVVDLRGLARPAGTQISATAGLAGVSGQVGEPLGTHAGYRLAANRTTPALLFSINPSAEPFDQLPGGWDTSGSVYLDSRALGSLRLFALGQADHVAVRLEQDAFVGSLRSSDGHSLVTAFWERPLGRAWDLTASIGNDGYTSGTAAGVMTLADTDHESSVRSDLGGRIGGWTVRFGGDANRVRSTAAGQVPSVGGDLGGVGGTSSFDVDHTEWRAGAYAEVTRSAGGVTTTVGARSDYFGAARAWRADPRVNVEIGLSRASRVRLAWGVYHQAPSPAYFDNVRGASSLAPMAATHYILGYEAGRPDGPAYFRAEAYAKTYRDLPVQGGSSGFTSNGYGWAHGIDLFARRTWRGIDLRASVSLLDTRRRWTSPVQQNEFPLPSGTWAPDFDVPHSWEIVGTAPITRTLSIGATRRAAAGRPFTPAIGAVPTDRGYAPIWGPINSDRLPAYARLDLALNWTRPIGARSRAIFFLAVGNALDRRNSFSYAYSSDYTQRRPVPGSAPRSIYVGCTWTR